MPNKRGLSRGFAGASYVIGGRRAFTEPEPQPYRPDRFLNIQTVMEPEPQPYRPDLFINIPTTPRPEPDLGMLFGPQVSVDTGVFLSPRPEPDLPVVGGAKMARTTVFLPGIGAFKRSRR